MKKKFFIFSILFGFVLINIYSKDLKTKNLNNNATVEKNKDYKEAYDYLLSLVEQNEEFVENASSQSHKQRYLAEDVFTRVFLNDYSYDDKLFNESIRCINVCQKCINKNGTMSAYQNVGQYIVFEKDLNIVFETKEEVVKYMLNFLINHFYNGNLSYIKKNIQIPSENELSLINISPHFGFVYDSIISKHKFTQNCFYQDFTGFFYNLNGKIYVLTTK